MPCLANESLDIAVTQFMQNWAEIQYHQPRDAKGPAFKTLAERVRQLAPQHPHAAEPIIWEAIAMASYAQMVKGREGLRAAKRARDLLLAAERINPRAMDGAIYITLGRLYFKVPGWPISFGSKRKARMYLEKALQINPAAIEANCFYADLLSSQGDYEQAMEYYQRALAAPARPGLEVADKARQKQAERGLRNAESRLDSFGIYNLTGSQ